MTPPIFRVPSGAPRSGRLTLDGPEGRHAADVRRLRAGEAIWLTDGAGARWEGTVGEVRRGALDIDVSRVVDEPPASLRLVAVQALAKGGRDEAAIEAMTEVGVDEVVAWTASRSIAKWTERTASKWQSTVEAAAKQARRAWWPAVTGPATTADVAARVRTVDIALVLSESAGRSIAEIDFADAAEVLVVVGPEGGISENELDAMTAAGGVPVRLGANVLRSSTAGVAALAAICARTRWA